MRSRAITVVMYLVGIAIVAVMVGYLATQRDLIANLRSISLGALLALLATEAGAAAVNGVQFRRVCEAFGVRMTYSEAFGLAVTNTMLNLAIPLKGGTVMRAAYMKKRYALDYTGYGALLASSQLLALACVASVGVLAAGLALWVEGGAYLEIAAVFVIAALGSIVGYLLIERLNFTRLKPRRLGEIMSRFARGFRSWRRHPRLAVAFAGTILLSIAIYVAKLWLIFWALGFAVDPMPLAVIAIAVSLSSTIPITPGNLGIREGVTALTASFLGIDPRIALLAGLVDRAVGLIVTVGLGVTFSRGLLRGWAETKDMGPPAHITDPGHSG